MKSSKFLTNQPEFSSWCFYIVMCSYFYVGLRCANLFLEALLQDRSRADCAFNEFQWKTRAWLGTFLSVRCIQCGFREKARKRKRGEKHVGAKQKHNDIVADSKLASIHTSKSLQTILTNEFLQKINIK